MRVLVGFLPIFFFVELLWLCFFRWFNISKGILAFFVILLEIFKIFCVRYLRLASARIKISLKNSTSYPWKFTPFQNDIVVRIPQQAIAWSQMTVEIWIIKFGGKIHRPTYIVDGEFTKFTKIYVRQFLWVIIILMVRKKNLKIFYTSNEVHKEFVDRFFLLFYFSRQ